MGSGGVRGGKYRDRRFVLALVVSGLMGWVIVPGEPARGILAGVLASVMTWSVL